MKTTEDATKAKPAFFILLLIGLLFLSAPDVWAAGVVGETLDVAGEIIAFPFEVIGSVFRAVF